MGNIVGTGDFQYEPVVPWARLPEGVSLVETPGVAVNSRDEVYALTRNAEYPVMVFDRDGRFLRSFGSGGFSKRTHGIFIGPDDTVYCADDGTHTITKFTREGELLMTIGKPGEPAEPWSGQPFNRPTHVAVSSQTGDIFVSDGYGNSRVHKYNRDGQHLLIAALAQGVFGRLAAAMGRPELADDPRFATGPARTEHDEALDAIVAQWCRERTLEELEAILHDAEVPASRIFSIADIFANPHYRARDMLIDVPDEELGSIKQAAPVPRFSRTPGKVSWSGRNVGQDTVRILREFGGYSEAEVERLREQGVVFCGTSAAKKSAPGKRGSRSPTRGGRGSRGSSRPRPG